MSLKARALTLYRDWEEERSAEARVLHNAHVEDFRQRIWCLFEEKVPPDHTSLEIQIDGLTFRAIPVDMSELTKMHLYYADTGAPFVELVSHCGQCSREFGLPLASLLTLGEYLANADIVEDALAELRVSRSESISSFAAGSPPSYLLSHMARRIRQARSWGPSPAMCDDCRRTASVSDQSTLEIEGEYTEGVKASATRGIQGEYTEGVWIPRTVT
jgi:hypothetical protein